MIRYSVERIKCDEKDCRKDATTLLRVFACQIRDESKSLFCADHADLYIARLDEMNAEKCS